MRLENHIREAVCKRLQAESGFAGTCDRRGLIRQAPGVVHRLRPHERDDAIEKQDVGEGREQVADEAFAVAPEPIEVAEGFAGTVKFPGLGIDSRDPARPLLNGGVESYGCGAPAMENGLSAFNAVEIPSRYSRSRRPLLS